MAILRVFAVHVTDLSRLDDILKLVETDIYPALAKAPGLRHWVSGRDPEGNKGFIASVWDTREQAEQGSAAISGTAEKLASMGYVIDEAYTMDVVHEITP